MIKPESLKRGSRVAIVSPAGSINPEFVESAANMIRAYGYEAQIYPACLNKHFQFGGNDNERFADVQSALDNSEIDAILCSRGGYGVVRLIDNLDFTQFMLKPKWFIGFSDITNFHIALNNLGVMSLHSQMSRAMHENSETDAVKNIFKILAGENPKTVGEIHEFNRKGKAQAELIGGNLSIIYSLLGTRHEINTAGKILFIEDLNEYLYHLDRMMIVLKMAGKLNNLKGLVVGSFSDMKDNTNPFGKTPYEIIAEQVLEYDFPVCYDFPLGHIIHNMPLVCGKTYNFEVGDRAVTLE